jgi:3-phenylpropionate/trans-cinnamate dioxygenase ferredoxin reductase component
MPDVRYLIVGGGMTADAAAHAIRERDSDGAIAIVGAEADPPYSRPPLTKALWKGDPFDSVWRRTGELPGVDLRLGRRVVRLDPAARRAVDDRGDGYRYDELLLATGATPRQLPFGGDAIIYFRTLADYRALRSMADRGAGESFAVIGGGFIGSEIAAALAMQGCKVTLVFPEAGLGARVFPAALSRFLVDYYREKGVTVRPGAPVTGIIPDGERWSVSLATGDAFTVDAVVAGIGVTPNDMLARNAGLATNDGIVVDSHLTTAAPHILAAGDVARFHSPQLGKAMRVEHEDNALTMGAAAGRIMTGDRSEYTHLPFFYSDLFDLGYEAVGDTDPSLQIVEDWKEPMREGVVYYLDGGRVRGVLLWNTWGQVDHARALIASPGPFSVETLKGRLPSD